MTPREQSAYHNYAQWFAQLLRMAEALTHPEGVPLDELLAVNVRATLTGTFMGPAGPEIVDVDRMNHQRRFLEAFIAFRSELSKDRIQIAPAGAVPPGPPAPGAVTRGV